MECDFRLNSQSSFYWRNWLPCAIGLDGSLNKKASFFGFFALSLVGQLIFLLSCKNFVEKEEEMHKNNITYQRFIVGTSVIFFPVAAYYVIYSIASAIESYRHCSSKEFCNDQKSINCFGFFRLSARKTAGITALALSAVTLTIWIASVGFNQFVNNVSGSEDVHRFYKAMFMVVVSSLSGLIGLASAHCLRTCFMGNCYPEKKYIPDGRPLMYAEPINGIAMDRLGQVDYCTT